MYRASARNRVGTRPAAAQEDPQLLRHRQRTRPLLLVRVVVEPCPVVGVLLLHRDVAGAPIEPPTIDGYSQFDVMSGAELGVHAARRAALRRRIRAL